MFTGGEGDEKAMRGMCKTVTGYFFALRIGEEAAEVKRRGLRPLTACTASTALIQDVCEIKRKLTHRVSPIFMAGTKVIDLHVKVTRASHVSPSQYFARLAT